MNTKIELTYQGSKYTLEYDRKTVVALENTGFRLDEFLEKPMASIDDAFKMAFLKNHPNVLSRTVQEIFEHCPDKSNLISTLYKMISETYDSLLADPEDDEGNASWVTVDLSPEKTNQK